MRVHIYDDRYSNKIGHVFSLEIQSNKHCWPETKSSINFSAWYNILQDAIAQFQLKIPNANNFFTYNWDYFWRKYCYLFQAWSTTLLLQFNCSRSILTHRNQLQPVEHSSLARALFLLFLQSLSVDSGFKKLLSKFFWLEAAAS